jgi:hypothetical protein
VSAHYSIITTGDKTMLATDKISAAFKAICDEAEKLQKKDLSRKSRKRLKTIISIARHQSDIRGAKKGACTAKAHCSAD